LKGYFETLYARHKNPGREKNKKIIVEKLEGIWSHTLPNDKWAAMKTNI
jgi:hypothetical protein